MNRPKQKVEGLIPPKESNETEKVSKITIGKKNLKLVLYDSNRKTTIYIGGHSVYCIYVDLIKNNGIYSSIGYLNKIRYDSVCSLEHDFVRGFDTNMLIKLLLTYISRNYKNVKQLAFNDASSRACDNGASINLASMYYILHGKTWYEKYFNAFLQEQDLITFNTYASEFQKKKQTTNWETLLVTIPQLKKLSIPEVELEELYTNTKTWQDFFKSILNKMEISDFCIFIQPWLDNFMMRYFRHIIMGFQYQMPIKDYAIEYTESPYQRGGKKFTRKAPKPVYRDEQ